MAKKLLIRLFSAALSTAFFLTNAAAPYAQEQSFWQGRRSAAQFARATENPAPMSGRALLSQMPPAAKVPLAANAPLATQFDWLTRAAAAHGMVRETYISPKAGAPLVVHIQDAHGIEEAQRNIAGLLETLTQEGPVKFVAVEGAAGAFRLDEFREAGPEITKSVADFFLAKGLIAGPEYAGLTARTPLDYQGAEDIALYNENLAALKEAHRRRDGLLPIYSRWKAETDRLVAAQFSPALKGLDSLSQSYEAGRTSLGLYIEGLAKISEPQKGLTNIALLRKTFALETAMDFKRVESERRRLVETLVARMSRKDLETLTARSLDHRAGRMGFAEYHRYLQDLCTRHGTPLSDQKSLSQYITYLAAAEKIKASDLLTELPIFETAAWKSLAKTPEQTRLLEARRRLSLLNKLLKHEMAVGEWNDYNTQRAAVLALPETLSALGGSPLPALSAADLKPFEDFWSLALRRNDAMIANVTARLTAANTGALVAGGFHTSGLTKLLKEKQISYVVMAPRFVAPSAESNYLDLLATDPRTIDQLLAGERLSLVKRVGLTMAEPSGFFKAFSSALSGTVARLKDGMEVSPCNTVHALNDRHVAVGNEAVDIKFSQRVGQGLIAAAGDFFSGLGRRYPLLSFGFRPSYMVSPDDKTLTKPAEVPTPAALMVKHTPDILTEAFKESVLANSELDPSFAPQVIGQVENANTAYKIRLLGSDGKQYYAVFKTHNISLGAQKEIVARRIAERLDIPMLKVPALVSRTLKINGMALLGTAHWFVEGSEGNAEFFKSHSARGLGFFDFLLANGDRHADRNFIYSEGETVYAIDNQALVQLFPHDFSIRNVPPTPATVENLRGWTEEEIRSTFLAEGLNETMVNRFLLRRQFILNFADRVMIDPNVWDILKSVKNVDTVLIDSYSLDSYSSGNSSETESISGEVQTLLRGLAGAETMVPNTAERGNQDLPTLQDGPPTPTGKAFSVRQHVAVFAAHVAAAAAAAFLPVPADSFLYVALLAVPLTWALGAGLPAALAGAVKVLSPVEPQRDIQVALQVDRWAQAMSNTVKRGVAIDWHMEPSNSWVAETIITADGTRVVRLASWLTARSSSVIYNKLRGLLLAMVLAHEGQRVAGRSASHIFFHKPLALVTSLFNPSLPSAAQSQEFVAPVPGSNAAAKSWKVRYFSYDDQPPHFVSYIHSLTPDQLAWLIKINTGIVVAAENLAMEMDVVLHGQGRQKRVYLAEILLNDGRRLPMALIDIAAKNETYIAPFVPGRTYHQVVQFGELRAEDRRAVVRELLAVARANNGFVPFDFNRNNFIVRSDFKAATMVDQGKRTIQILNALIQDRLQAPQPEDHLLFMGMLLTQFGHSGVADGSNQHLLASIEEALGAPGRRILENALAELRQRGPEGAIQLFQTKGRHMFKELRAEDYPQAFHWLERRLRSDLALYLENPPRPADRTPSSGESLAPRLAAAARWSFIVMALLAGTQLPKLAHAAPTVSPAAVVEAVAPAPEITEFGQADMARRAVLDGLLKNLFLGEARPLQFDGGASELGGYWTVGDTAELRDRAGNDIGLSQERFETLAAALAKNPETAKTIREAELGDWAQGAWDSYFAAITPGNSETINISFAGYEKLNEGQQTHMAQSVRAQLKASPTAPILITADEGKTLPEFLKQALAGRQFMLLNSARQARGLYTKDGRIDYAAVKRWTEKNAARGYSVNAGARVLVWNAAMISAEDLELSFIAVEKVAEAIGNAIDAMRQAATSA